MRVALVAALVVLGVNAVVSKPHKKSSSITLVQRLLELARKDDICVMYCDAAGDTSSGDVCIEQSKVCDGNQDCEDNRDEANCGKRNLHGKSLVQRLLKMARKDNCQYECTSAEDPNEKECIEDDDICNNEVDCANGKDEADCAHCVMYCDAAGDTSSGDVCIGLSKVCDGTQDCEDNSDEANCGALKIMLRKILA